LFVNVNTVYVNIYGDCHSGIWKIILNTLNLIIQKLSLPAKIICWVDTTIFQFNPKKLIKKKYRVFLNTVHSKVMGIVNMTNKRPNQAKTRGASHIYLWLFQIGVSDIHLF
jgi:hypothetical protein